MSSGGVSAGAVLPGAGAAGGVFPSWASASVEVARVRPRATIVRMGADSTDLPSPPPVHPAPGRAAGWLRLGAAALLAGWGLLTILEVPTDALWKPAIAATEWGHVLALGALAVAAAPRWRTRPAKAGAAVAGVAALLFLSPYLRARAVADDLEERLEAAFGAPAPLPWLGSSPLRLGGLGLGRTVAVGDEPTTRRYSGDLALDLYLPPDQHPRPRPVVLVVHGGSWRGGDRTQLPAICRWLAARGHAAASLDHRLAPAHPFPAAHEDVLAAIAWVRREGPALGLDPARLVLYGRSSGAHLALLAAYASPPATVRGVIALYPPTDLVWSWEHPTNPRVLDTPGVLRDFLGGSPAERPGAYRAASPLGLAAATSPPTLLLHGGRDELVFVRQSQRLAERLAELRVAHLLVELPWATHGCDANLDGPSGQLLTFSVERFLAAVAR